MIEYLFFNPQISLKFIAILQQKGLEWEEGVESILKAISIQISEDIDDDLWDELDDIYEALTLEDQQILEEDLDDENQINAAGIYLQLSNGKQTLAKINPDVMNRMLDVISMEEFNAFIETIVSSVEKPDDGPICNLLSEKLELE